MLNPKGCFNPNVYCTGAGTEKKTSIGTLRAPDPAPAGLMRRRIEGRTPHSCGLDPIRTCAHTNLQGQGGYTAEEDRVNRIFTRPANSLALFPTARARAAVTVRLATRMGHVRSLAALPRNDEEFTREHIHFVER